jgi:hypothetical protein
MPSSNAAASCSASLRLHQPSMTKTKDYRDRYLRLTGMSLVDCPACQRGRMVCIETLPPRPPAQGPPDGRA